MRKLKCLLPPLLILASCCHTREENPKGIITALSSENPDSVYVANTVLSESELGGIDIDFDKPYKNSKKRIEEKIEELKGLDSNEIRVLNRDYFERMKFHSPTWLQLEGWSET